MIPYARHFITEADLNAVSYALRSDWLTTGPMIGRFEAQFAERHGARYAVAMSSCTAALHAAARSFAKHAPCLFEIPALTFVATANAALYAVNPINFVDVQRDTLTMDCSQLSDSASIAPVSIVVEYAGLDCSPETEGVIFDKAHGCGNPHSGFISCYSLHAAKHITTGEGGMLTTNDGDIADFARRFRNHGIGANGDMVDFGYNYRMTDFQAALGMSQLATLDMRIERRREIATAYNAAFNSLSQIEIMPYPVNASVWHLYPIRLDLDRLTITRDEFRSELKERDIGTQVHYRPVYYHPYYRRLGYRRGLCPVAEAEYERLVSLPMWYGMTDENVLEVIKTVTDVCNEYAR